MKFVFLSLLLTAALLVFSFFNILPFQSWISVLTIIIVIIFLTIVSIRLNRSNLEVKVARNELKGIIENLRDGVVAYDPNFKILLFNKAAGQIFNLSESDVLGAKLTPEFANDKKFRFLAQVIFPSLAPAVTKVSEAGKFPQVTDVFLSDPNVELRVITDEIVDPLGNLLGFIKLVHDRTREVGLIRSQTEFISTAAHQLRTPLTAIRWSLETLTSSSLTSEQKETVGMGMEALAGAVKTVDDMLDISKIEEGKFGYKFENLEIIGFLESVIREMQGFHKNSTVRIFLENKERSPITISADQSRLKVALSNVIDNAFRYNVENGEITVTVERLKDKPYLEIKVKDTGVGIPKDDLPKVFTKFFRAQNISETAPDGSGLGLYIVKNIVRRHGGEIWAESELNRGSTFHFTLPTDSSLIPPKEIVYGEE